MPVLISLILLVYTCGAPAQESSFKNVRIKEAFPGLTFDKPVFIAESPVEKGIFYVLEQNGIIKTVRKGDRRTGVFLDLRDRVRSGGEMGLLGFAFDPDFGNNGFIYVYYTDKSRNTIISRFKAISNTKAHKNSERVLFKYPQPYSNHNGGMIAFGPDGLLYAGLGDGGSAGDPLNHGQNPRTPLGSFIRIDVRKPNPSYEIFAIGFRNPWRWSFDRETGMMWAGDVGQDRWEEIDIVEKGKNYGWRCYEGNEPYNTRGCGPKEKYTFPVHTYPLKDGNCSVIGGYVYRGKEMPFLEGWFIFGDYCSGRIWALKYESGRKRVRLLMDTDLMISSFGEDSEGNLYVIDHRGGRIYRLSP